MRSHHVQEGFPLPGVSNHYGNTSLGHNSQQAAQQNVDVFTSNPSSMQPPLRQSLCSPLVTMQSPISPSHTHSLGTAAPDQSQMDNCGALNLSAKH